MLKQIGVAAAGVVAIGVVALAVTKVNAEASAPITPFPQFTATSDASPSPAPTLDPLIAVIGDGYSSGSTMNSGPQTLWTARAAKKLGVRVQQLAVTGSGYLTSNPDVSDQSTMAARAAEVSKSTAVIVFFGGSADVGVDTTNLQATAESAFKAAEKRAPHAKLIVVGPAREGALAPSTVMADRDQIEAAAKAANATWVDPIADSWFPPGSSLIGSDGTYPTDAGESRIAALLEPVLTKALAKK